MGHEDIIQSARVNPEGVPLHAGWPEFGDEPGVMVSHIANKPTGELAQTPSLADLVSDVSLR
jgi:hypothetical protein